MSISSFCEIVFLFNSILSEGMLFSTIYTTFGYISKDRDILFKRRYLIFLEEAKLNIEIEINMPKKGNSCNASFKYYIYS